jgi:pyruvate formate-lyase/glycerol dehydratase family glycyl radical enzyme
MSQLCGQNEVLKNKLLTAEYHICTERARFYTESYKTTEGEAPFLRVAKALKHTFEKMTIRIEPEELLVGNRSSQLIAPPIAPERGDYSFILKYLLPDLVKFGYKITAEDKRILFEEVLPYWQNKTVREMKVEEFVNRGLCSKMNLSPREIHRKRQMFGRRVLLKLLMDKRSMTKEEKAKKVNSVLLNLPRYLKGIKFGAADNIKGRGRCIDTQAHIVIGYKNVLKDGFKGIEQKATLRLETVTTPSERSFLESIIITCQAVKEFSERFAKEAAQLANSAKDSQRKSELRLMADACAKVPYHAPETFYEAMQAIWFTQNAIIISYGSGSGITPGRVDQLLYPYYLLDRQKPDFDEALTLRLVEEFIIKINNNMVIWPNVADIELNPLGSDVENITIGGVDKDGNNAVNDLSYLFIKAIRNTKLATTVSFRISENSPANYIQKVLAIHKDTDSPALLNDTTVIRTLMNDGYSLEDARQYCLVGCVEPSGNGDTYGATGGTKVYLPTAIDMMLNRGRTAMFGNQDGPDTGNPEKFKRFSDVMDAFYTQLEFMVKMAADATNIRDRIWADHYPNPFISSTIDGCIENVKDATNGGATYNFGNIGAGGMATAVDSLAAIKKLVFEDKKISIQELNKAIAVDFRKHEKTRNLLRRGPKFGVDDDEVDLLAKEIIERFCAIVKHQRRFSGGHYKASFISYGLNVFEGKMEPATPDGRKAGKPLSNSFSPSNGVEKLGPTAALNSLAKINQTLIGYGNSVNMRFPSQITHQKSGMILLESLIKTYFKKGGAQIQINTIDTEVLKKAQTDPSEYGDLIVRVSGYSAYFTRLGKNIQNDIIERLEFSEN